MPKSHDASQPGDISPGERSLFWRQIAFRLCLGLWALYAVLFLPFSKALLTLVVLGLFDAMGEVVFVSLQGYARLKARREAEQRLREEQQERRAAKAAAAKIEAGKYFAAELGEDASSQG